MFTKTHKRKPNAVRKTVKILSFISFGLLLLRLGYSGKIGAESIALLFVVLIVVLAMGKQVLYALLGIVSFFLFVKLNTNGSQEEWSVIISVITLGLVMLVIYKMIKTLFSK